MYGGVCVCMARYGWISPLYIYEAVRLLGAASPPGRLRTWNPQSSESSVSVNQGKPASHHAEGHTKPNQPGWRENRNLAAQYSCTPAHRKTGFPPLSV